MSGSALDSGERQVAPSVELIRRDHRERYEWATRFLDPGCKVVDAACGVGYGSKILARHGCEVRAYDKSEEAIAYAKSVYNHDGRIRYDVADVYHQELPKNFDAVCAFEILEHLAKPEKALRRWREMAPVLFVSVPNEECFPFKNQKFHARHYRKNELEELLRLNGYEVQHWYGQAGPESPVEPDVMGRTLCAVAIRTDEPMGLKELEPPADDEILESLKLPGRDLPKSVAIVAMGGSMMFYHREAARAGGHRHLADEVWVVNNMAGVSLHDRVIHMDDLKIQEARVAAQPDENPRKQAMEGMLGYLKESTAPIYTPRAYEDYPASVEYPLEWVVNKLETYYINNTPAAGICLALAMGVEELRLYGMDFSYPDGDRHKAERGRACVEFWLGWAAARGVKALVPEWTTLLDQNMPAREKYYGYDTEWLKVEVDREANRINIARTPRDPQDIPTPQEMEARYSHDARIEQQAALAAARRK